MNKIFTLTVIFFLMTLTITAQVDETKFTIFDAKGNQVGFQQIIEKIGLSEVVFLGEQHDDSVAHALQMQILQKCLREILER